MKYSIKIGITGLVIAILLFLVAGRLDWFDGWVFVLLWMITKVTFAGYIGNQNPELAAERSERHRNTKHWDRILMPMYLLMGFTTFFVAALDGGRFGWSARHSFGIQVTAILVHLAFHGLALWAASVNPYLSSEARIQQDRGQQVITTGPYQYIRHPTYAATVILWLTTPVILGSWWGLIPAALAGGMMIARTALEDHMLLQELSGYKEYTQIVHHRLVPGVW